MHLFVYWLRILDKLETRPLSPNKTYGAYMVLNFTDNANGFDLAPAEISVKLSSAEEVELNPLGRQECQGQVPKERGDGWMEIEMGEFFNERCEDELETSLGFRSSMAPRTEVWTVGCRTVEDPYVMTLTVMEVRGANWKSSLIIKGIEIRPKGNQ